KVLKTRSRIRFVPCGAHRLSNTIKTALEAAGIMGSTEMPQLVEKTLTYIQAINSRDKLRCYIDDDIRLILTKEGIEHVVYTIYSVTRFGGIALMGRRFVKNAEIARRLHSEYLKDPKDKRFKGYPADIGNDLE